MTTTFDRYEILDTIGSGGMATVYRAHDPRFDREVAIKIMSADYAHNQTFVQRFLREAKTVAGLEHTAIVPVYDYGRHDGRPFLVMRYMSGGSLADRIKQGPLPLREAARILNRIAEALDWAHSQAVIHRDVKPANILFDQQNYPCLADFGIVKLTESTTQLTGSGMVGTPAYMAPEMMDKGGLTYLVDVYALSVTLFQMLAGRHPFEADTPMGVLMAHVNKPAPDIRQLRPDLPDTVQAVIECGMAKDPMARFQSAGALAAAFHDAITEPQSPVPPPPPVTLESEPEPIPAVSPPPVVTPDTPTVDIGEDTTSPPVIEAISVEPAPIPDKTRRSSFPWVWIGGIGAVLMIGIIGVIGLIALLGNIVPSSQAAPEPTQTVEAGDVNITGLAPTSTTEIVPTTAPTDQPTPIPPTPTNRPTVEPTRNLVLVLAETGVSSNGDWEPYIQDFDGVQMALVPAGCFTMGSTEDEVNAALVLCEAAYGEGECKRDWFDDEQPTHKVCFDEPFWIDVYEVTNEQYGSSGEWSGDDLPREEVNWSDALAHCESREARLPTEAEWEYAARGPDSLIFPWGNTFDGSLVNFCDENCTEDWADKNVDDGYQNTAPVGSYPGGVSWVGVYDLSGNVWEWVNDWFGSDYYDSSPATNPQGPGSGEYRVMQGGSWYTNANSVRAALRGRENPSDRYLNLGFRCALSYEP